MKSQKNNKQKSNKVKDKKDKLNQKDFLLKLARLENDRKRFESEKLMFINFANQKLLLEVIEILDAFFLALNSTNVSEEVKNWLVGFKMIKNQFENLLKNNGVKIITTQKNDDFNPEIHNSIEEVESDLKPGKIVEIVKFGYWYNDRLLRPVMVKTSKKK